MTFTTGQRVRFKGDPENGVFVVSYGNRDGSVDLETPGGGSWECVPERLLEPASVPVEVGNVYRAGFTGDLLFVVGRGSWGVLVVQSSDPEKPVQYSEGSLLNPEAFHLVYPKDDR